MANLFSVANQKMSLTLLLIFPLLKGKLHSSKLNEMNALFFHHEIHFIKRQCIAHNARKKFTVYDDKIIP